MELFAPFGVPDDAGVGALCAAGAPRIFDVDPVFAATAVAHLRAVLRAGVPVGQLAELAGLAAMCAAVWVAADSSTVGRAQVGASAHAAGGAPSPVELEVAAATLTRYVPAAAAAVAAQLEGAGASVLADGPAAAEVLRRAALVCAHTESVWSEVAACGWVAAVAGNLVGVPADVAAAAGALRPLFDAATDAAAPHRAPGVPLVPFEAVRPSATGAAAAVLARLRRRQGGHLDRPIPPQH